MSIQRTGARDDATALFSSAKAWLDYLDQQPVRGDAADVPLVDVHLP